MLFSLVFLLSCTMPKLIIQTSHDDVVVSVEVAETQLSHQKGLMFRTDLKDSEGMFFVFEDEKLRSFWMKNTVIPLDIIFISANKKIIDILENFQPCIAEPCEAYTSASPAKYVLETNAGFVRKNKISLNDSIRI